MQSVENPYTGHKEKVPTVIYGEIPKVEQHWSQIRKGQELTRKDQVMEYDMLKRLAKGKATEYDYNFYMHELLEKEIMEEKYGGCYSYENLKKAHEEALEKAGITDYDLWYPDIRRKYREKGHLGPYFDDK